MKGPVNCLWFPSSGEEDEGESDEESESDAVSLEVDLVSNRDSWGSDSLFCDGLRSELAFAS